MNDVDAVVGHKTALGDVEVVGNDGERARHGLPTELDVPRTLFWRLSRGEDEAREAMTVDD